MNNPLIEFLAAYGPVANGQNMYDEFVMDEANKAGIEPLNIQEDRSEFTTKILMSENPVTVILTGTAGDGKTYTARKVLHQISNGKSSWTNDQSELTVTCTENGKKITFVKDLSEIRHDEKKKLVPRIVESLFTDSSKDEIFVVCVNDGHLIKTWREHSDGERAKQTIEMITYMLREDKDSVPEDDSSTLSFRFFNMSRTSHAATLDHIIDAITNHPAWEGCLGCPALNTAKQCPIRVNRSILKRTNQESVRKRLRGLIEIAAADGAHLSIRQIMILTVNALLGDSSPNLPVLLNCDRAREIAERSYYAATNPYANLFGENHPIARRYNLQAFEVLSRFGIGEETTNFFDNFLLDEETTDLPNDDRYGNPIFEQIRADYWEDPSTGYEELRPAIRDQRRRLFFLMQDAKDESLRDQNPWHLSTYQWGDAYINLLRGYEECKKDLYKLAQLGIVKGMNRALNCSLTETQDRLWLTRSSGVYLGNEMPLLSFEPIAWRHPYYRLILSEPSAPGRPPRIEIQNRQCESLSNLDLTPTLFEYLMRVARGALPTSFTNQCYQELRNFQIRFIAAIEQDEQTYTTISELKAVDTNSEGALHAKSIVLLEESL